MIKKDPDKSGQTALWKEFMESGVRVYPVLISYCGHTEIVEEGGPSEYRPPTAIDAITIENCTKVIIQENPRAKA
jgi:hypothetical protein